ncbi:MAG: hypothetical protein JWL63_951 [Rhodocyclales bacterium]|nr:hypothetical protein [Rhodocyclales bacterium]
MPFSPDADDATLLREAMRFFEIEQRQLLLKHGALTQNRMLILLLRKGPLSQSDLVKMMGLEKSWVSRAADRLATQKWLEKVPNPHDRRGVLLTLTPAGEKQAVALDTVLEGHSRAVLSRLNPEARVDVMSAMALLRGVLSPQLWPDK